MAEVKTPDEARQEAYNEALNQIHVTAGREIATYLPLIADAVPQFKDAPAPTTDQEFAAIGRGLINDRELRIGDASIGIRDLRTKLVEKYQNESLIPDLEKKIPSENQSIRIANATADGVKDNVGTIGFLQGASVSNAFFGFIKWIANFVKGLFGGDKKDWSLTDFIKNETAVSMGRSVGQNLQVLRDSDPTIAQHISNSAINQASEGVYVSISQKLEVAGAADLSMPESGEVKQIGDIRSMVRREVHTQVSAGVLRSMKDRDYWTKYLDKYEFNRSKISDAIGDAVAGVVASDDFHSLSRDKAVDRMVEAAEAAIKGKVVQPYTYNIETSILDGLRAELNQRMGLDEKGRPISGASSEIPQIDYSKLEGNEFASINSSSAMQDALDKHRDPNYIPPIPDGINHGGVPHLNDIERTV